MRSLALAKYLKNLAKFVSNRRDQVVRREDWRGAAGAGVASRGCADKGQNIGGAGGWGNGILEEKRTLNATLVIPRRKCTTLSLKTDPVEEVVTD